MLIWPRNRHQSQKNHMSAPPTIV